MDITWALTCRLIPHIYCKVPNARVGTPSEVVHLNLECPHFQKLVPRHGGKACMISGGPPITELPKQQSNGCCLCTACSGTDGGLLGHTSFWMPNFMANISDSRYQNCQYMLSHYYCCDRAPEDPMICTSLIGSAAPAGDAANGCEVGCPKLPQAQLRLAVSSCQKVKHGGKS